MERRLKPEPIFYVTVTGTALQTDHWPCALQTCVTHLTFTYLTLQLLQRIRKLKLMSPSPTAVTGRRSALSHGAFAGVEDFLEPTCLLGSWVVGESLGRLAGSTAVCEPLLRQA